MRERKNDDLLSRTSRIPNNHVTAYIAGPSPMARAQARSSTDTNQR